MAVPRLSLVAGERGAIGVADRLGAILDWIGDDLRTVEADLAAFEPGSSIVTRSACHLLELGGKRLRPLSVALAAKMGTGFDDAARHLAVAVELMHDATLLHDDVIDLGERRRGKPAARLVYGNAASVLAGDWLLVDALKRIGRSGHAALLPRALDTLDEIIEAEAIQLENRGRINPSHDDYFQILDGKTAALFRWAMDAGATAGGLPSDQRAALVQYGTHFGAAFQLIDDLLDVAGDPETLGKSTFNDLHQGKMTYPLLLALDRDDSLRRLIEPLLDLPADRPVPTRLRARVQRKLQDSGSLTDCRRLAQQRAREAVACLEPLPAGPGRDALASLAHVPVDRES